ncbi:amidase [Novosphingobium sp. FSW06-99]|uniref:amidase n=1 Tax=Novosphingobium sp. FSW06-99 TaxID=1739113 RepID=UPI000A9A748F|nr:amidase [Novosphingobium sp. FSW06-99]
MTMDLPHSLPLTQWPARTLVAAIAARQVSSVEVTSAFLDRIEAINPRVNAIIAMRDRADILADAERADRMVASGAPLGVLHGLPHAVKDLEPVAGLAWTQGSPIFARQIARHDGLVAERLRRAGVIFVGKTNTPEFGLGSHSFNPVWGVTRNPWNLALSAGGSSGGAAAALATDMLPLADGSDYGGSLRNPAGWNNVCGFRTSLGRIATEGAEDWLVSPAVTGPMARDVGDLALMLSVMAGWDARMPLAMQSDAAPLRAVEPVAMKGLRIAWSGDFGGQVPFDPGVLDVARQAVDRFAAMGAHVEQAVPDFPVAEVWRAFVGLRHFHSGAGMLPLYNDPATRRLLKPEALWEIERGFALSAYDVAALSAIRTGWSRAVAAFLCRYDVWIVPTAQVFPFPVEQHWPTVVGGQAMQTYHEWMQAVCLVTMAGCPALAVPAGFSATGLPMGVQIVAPIHGEATCLAVAAAYEAAAADLFRTRPAV